MRHGFPSIENGFLTVQIQRKHQQYQPDDHQGNAKLQCNIQQKNLSAISRLLQIRPHFRPADAIFLRNIYDKIASSFHFIYAYGQITIVIWVDEVHHFPSPVENAAIARHAQRQGHDTRDQHDFNPPQSLLPVTHMPSPFRFSI